MAHSRHLALEDLRLARDPDHLLALFRKLAYRTEPELVPLDPLDLEFPDRAGIQRCFLLADHPGPPGLQVFLFELDGVRVAELRLLARDLLARPGHYLFVAVPPSIPPACVPPPQSPPQAGGRRGGTPTSVPVSIRGDPGCKRKSPRPGPRTGDRRRHRPRRVRRC